MLYGIRRDLQARADATRVRVRVYVPFGREWFPYFMRRLGERPANIGFVIRGVLRERLKSVTRRTVSRVAARQCVANDVTRSPHCAQPLHSPPRKLIHRYSDKLAKLMARRLITRR